MTIDIGQPEITAGVAVGELFVIQAQRVQDGRLDILRIALGVMWLAHSVGLKIMTFGMGDSRSDARFMAACDYAIIPRGTQLSALALEAL